LWAEKKPSTSKLQGHYHISLFKKITLLKPDLKDLLQKNNIKGEQYHRTIKSKSNQTSYFKISAKVQYMWRQLFKYGEM
jgi:hypothetical protein